MCTKESSAHRDVFCCWWGNPWLWLGICPLQLPLGELRPFSLDVREHQERQRPSSQSGPFFARSLLNCWLTAATWVSLMRSGKETPSWTRAFECPALSQARELLLFGTVCYTTAHSCRDRVFSRTKTIFPWPFYSKRFTKEFYGRCAVIFIGLIF